MPEVFDGTVNEATCARLMAQQAESAEVDYKSQLDLSQTRDRVELAKDIAAMAALGGYILVGVDGRGVSTGTVTEGQIDAFDEARLMAQLRRYLPASVVVTVAGHPVGVDAKVVVIGVHAHKHGLVVMQGDGQYEINGKAVPVFRRGDIFVRHGTSSERAQQEDIHAALERVISARKEQWREEVYQDFEHLRERSNSVIALTNASSVAVDWNTPLDVLTDATFEYIRRGDLTPLRLLMLSARAEVKQRMADDSAGTVNDVLDRVITISAASAAVEGRATLDSGVKALAAIYSLGFARGDEVARPNGTRLWLDVLARIEALGGLLVRLEQWDDVRALVLAGPRAPSIDFYGNWIRHAETEAARANDLVAPNDAGKMIEIAVLDLARGVADRVQALRADGLEAGDEEILDSLCQFDALAALVAVDAAGSTDSRHFYTNFALFYSHRATPVLGRLISDSVMRARLWHRSDQDLAVALREVLRMADGEAARHGRLMFSVGAPLESWISSNSTPPDSNVRPPGHA